jgi:hypothetical protein
MLNKQRANEDSINFSKDIRWTCHNVASTDWTAIFQINF